MAPKSANAVESLSRPRAAPTNAPLVCAWAAHQRGDIQGVLPLLVRPSAQPPRTDRSERRRTAQRVNRRYNPGNFSGKRSMRSITV